MAEFTPNYNLEKPAGAEKYYISKFNANADKIDTALKGHDDTIAANKKQEEQDIADTKEYADNAVSEHNMSEGDNVHPYLQRKITEAADKALADAKDYAYSKTETDERISVHNSDESAHQDIRNLINSMGTDVQTDIENAIAVHNASPESHPDIRTDYANYTDNAVSTHNNDPEAHGGKDVVYTKLAAMGNGFTSSMTHADIITAFQDGKNVVALLNSGGEVQLETDGANITGKRTVIEGDKMVLETYALDPETNMFTKTSTKYLLDYAPAIADEAIADVSIIVDPESDEEATKIGGADWNAQEGEAGYIANKPFGEIDNVVKKIDPKYIENSFVIDVDLNNMVVKTSADDIRDAVANKMPIYVHNGNASFDGYIAIYDFVVEHSGAINIEFASGNDHYVIRCEDNEVSISGESGLPFHEVRNINGKLGFTNEHTVYWLLSNSSIRYNDDLYTVVSRTNDVYIYRNEKYGTKTNGILHLIISELKITVLNYDGNSVDIDYTIKYTSTTHCIQTVPMVTFMTYDGSSVIGTSTVTNGTPDSIPTAPTRTNYGWVGWNTTANSSESIALENITDDITVYAAYTPVEVKEITDSWDTIIANIDNNTYKSKYKIGNYKPLDLGTEGTINMQIVGINVDKNRSGATVPLTFIGMELLNTSHRMNPSKTAGTEGTGTLGGWEKSEMRSYLNDTILPLIPSNVAERINAVKKISKAYDVNETAFQQTTYDKLWIPGHREIFNSTTYDQTGPVYSAIYKDNSSRIKSKVGGSAYGWWLRSASSTTGFRGVVSVGADFSNVASYSVGVCPGFCF